MNRRDGVRLLPVVDLALAVVLILAGWYAWVLVSRWWPW